jgi:hypothetical protein
MIVVRGIDVYPEQELLNAGMTPDEIKASYLRLPDMLFLISAAVQRKELYDLYLESYDTSVPQSWFDEYCAKHGGTAPEAVWSYNKEPLTGEPVFWAEILKMFARDVRIALREYVRSAKQKMESHPAPTPPPPDKDSIHIDFDDPWKTEEGGVESVEPVEEK